MNFEQEFLDSISLQTREKIASLQKDIEQLNVQIGDQPDYSNPESVNAFKKLTTLREELDSALIFQKKLNEHTEAQALLNDSELGELAKESIAPLQKELSSLYEILFVKKSKYQDVVMEIRAGAGGDEAALFVRDVFKMYSLFAGQKGWAVEITDTDGSLATGFKYVSAFVRGPGAYELLQFESGVHRVQRIPATESAGRIHTSTISVAILPEVEDVDVQINPSDLEIEAYRSSGPGGQNVNKVSSAVRVKHIPTGIVVTCQENRSQLKNRENAIRMLKSRIYQQQAESQSKEISDMRKQQIGSADRSEKIRTYNYPQSRITDHRIKKSWFNLSGIMNGNLEDLLTDVIDLMTHPEKIQGNGDDND